MPGANREEAIQTWMHRFKTELYPEVEFYEDLDGVGTAKYIQHTYTEKLNESVKPRMQVYEDGDHRVDRHKIASLYELVIVYLAPIMPVEGTPEGEINPLNAHFAYFVGQIIIEGFNKRTGNELELFISDEFDREHLSLLSISTVSDGMVFANSASWYLVEKYCLDINSKTK
jgi:hypothetical protein